MREAHRLRLYLIWLNWFELVLKDVTKLRGVPYRFDEQDQMICSELVAEWSVQDPTDISHVTHVNLMKRLLWGWRTVQHAERAGLNPPEQPLLPWRLHMLVSDWWWKGMEKVMS